MNKKFSLSKLFLAVALISAAIGALYIARASFNLDKKSAEAKEALRPANLEITIISTPNCLNCFNIDEAVADIEKQNIQVKERKNLVHNSEEAQDLIQKFAIKKVPTYIATGEITKKNIESFIKNNGEIQDSTFIFTKTTPVYIETANGQEMGGVKVSYLLDATCTQCIDLKRTIEAFKRAGVAVIEEKEFQWNSQGGKELIKKYKIELIPTFLLSSDIALYDSIIENWPNMGTVASDGTYIATKIPMPYRDVNKGIVGLVDVIYLKDFSCAECYKSEEIHKRVLTQGFGVGFRSEKIIDSSSSSGKGLVKKYQITKVPTLLISPQVSEYENIKSVWSQVGTIEKDGWYVFRQMEQLGGVVYKDLSSNQIIRPSSTNSNETP